MAIFTILLLIPIFLASSVLSQISNDCVKGPQSWCNSLDLAKKCGAVNHCAELWRSQKNILKSDDQNCQFCLFMVNKVKQLIENSETEDKIRYEIQVSCDVLSDKDNKNKCLSLQDELYFTMGVLLNKQISPFWICNGIQMCNATNEMLQFKTSDEVNHANPLDFHDANEYSIIIDKNELVGNDEINFDENDFKGDPQTIQDTMPMAELFNSEKLSNFTMVDEGFIVDLLKDFNKNMIKSGLQEENLCDMCQRGVKNLDILLRSPDFQHDLLKYADKFCKDLHDIRDNFMCQEGLKKLLPDMIKVFDNKLMSSDVCVKAQICSAKTLLLLKNRVQPSANLCADCKNLVGQVKDFLDKTEPKIFDAAKHFCQSFPNKIQEKCSSMIKEYIPSVYEYLNMIMDPVQMCQAFGICQLGDNKPIGDMKMTEAVQLAQNFLLQGVPLFSSVAGRENAEKSQVDDSKLAEIPRYMPINFNGVSKNVKVSQFTQGDEPNSYECELCKLVTGALIKQLGNNRTVDNIKYELNKVCEVLPKNWSKECRYFVTTYTDTLVILLENNSNVTEICHYFDFCQLPDNPTQSLTMLSSPTQDFNYCPVCHFIVHWIAQQIGKNASDEKLIAWGKDFCSKLPAVWAQECDDYIDAYGLQALRIISDSMDPDVVCQQLGMCQMKRVDILYKQPHAAAEDITVRAPHKLLGFHKCTFGPGYWCRSAEIAALCHAEDYCKSNGGYRE